MLEWARRRAGLSLEEAARAIGLSGATAATRLGGEMEAGKRVPSRPQSDKNGRAVSTTDPHFLFARAA